MTNKISQLIQADIGFAVIASNGIFDHRDWFIAVCPNDKSIIKELRCKKNTTVDGVYEIDMKEKDVKEFGGMKDQFKIDTSCDFGVVYEYKPRCDYRLYGHAI